MLKTTSLVSVIAVTDLLYAVELIISQNFKQIPLLMVAVIWYLIATSVLTAGQYYLERHYARGTAHELPPTPLQRLRRMLLIRHVEPPLPPLIPPRSLP
jgi:polar amino acid transport system permease protein